MNAPAATTTLTDADLDALRLPLTAANAGFALSHPGETTARQPVHTVYGGAQLFKSDTTVKMGQRALAALATYAPYATRLAHALKWSDSEFASTVYDRVVAKLQTQAVEDFRIDFEDGYGNRPDAEEDAEAERCAREVAAGMEAETLPPFIGIRIKPFSEELVARGLRTMDIFLSTLLSVSGGSLPTEFVVTLPKVVIPEQITALVQAFERIEAAHNLAAGSLRLELMVETPQSILGDDGHCALPELVDAAQGRCRGAHFGTYDYTALCQITAAYQHMTHPACDFARHFMQVSLSQRGLMLSDGATNVMPVGPHRAAPGEELTFEQLQENEAVVHRAWKLGYDHIRHSLEHAFYQGWDLHPAQLPMRYAAIYAFFLEGLDAASARLSTFVEKAAQATLLGDVFDDAATGQGLLNFFLRGLSSGAITEAEATATGLTVEEFRTRSFLAILRNR
jgi:citrate lyase beta subunit